MLNIYIATRYTIYISIPPIFYNIICLKNGQPAYSMLSKITCCHIFNLNERICATVEVCCRYRCSFRGHTKNSFLYLGVSPACQLERTVFFSFLFHMFYTVVKIFYDFLISKRTTNAYFTY